MESFITGLKNWKTTILGILPTIAAVAIALGWIDLEQQTAIINGVEVVFDNTENILNEVIGGIAAVAGVIGVFSKDADKSSKQLGIE